jgi:hypothetical protein
MKKLLIAIFSALALTTATADEVVLADGDVCPYASLFGCYKPIWEYRTLGGGDNGPAASSGPGQGGPAADAGGESGGGDEGGDDNDSDSDDKPGYGYGDDNHDHSGPPGQNKGGGGGSGDGGDNAP